MELVQLSTLHRSLLAAMTTGGGLSAQLSPTPHRQLTQRLVEVSEALLYAREAAPGFDPEWLRRFIQLAEAATHAAGATEWDHLLRLAEELLSELSHSVPLPTRPSVHPPDRTRVQQVTDGDTFIISGGWRVRLIGMDAPELHGANGHPEPLAVTARQTLAALSQYRLVRLVGDRQDRDRYGRLLRYAYSGDTCLNLELVRLGLAVAFPVRPNLRFQSDFEQAESEARQAHRGIWAE